MTKYSRSIEQLEETVRRAKLIHNLERLPPYVVDAALAALPRVTEPTTVITIDARGVDDPAQIRAACFKALSDRNKRMPRRGYGYLICFQ
jgi:hypothetical protein